ncbi:MAG TPA: hypothetical protein VL306_00945 [Methylomirabilota bacterium]|nr:hypothetical protein [Methylomirabilota bacterium]
MALPSAAFVPFTHPVIVVLNLRLVNGSMPQLRQYGVLPENGVLRVSTIGVNKDGSVVRLNTKATSSEMVPQVVKRVIHENPELEKEISLALRKAAEGIGSS